MSDQLRDGIIFSTPRGAADKRVQLCVEIGGQYLLLLRLLLSFQARAEEFLCHLRRHRLLTIFYSR